MADQVKLGAAILLVYGHKLFLLLRDDKPGLNAALQWAVLAGALEVGENAEDAIYREIGEEIGTNVDGLECIGKTPANTWYIGTLNGQQVANIRQAEGCAHGFFSYDGLVGLAKIEGKGTRMKELVASLPKPLIQVGGKSVLQWKLDALPASIHEVITVVNHQKEKIMAVFPHGVYHAPSGSMKIIFAEQLETKGTADALWAAKQYISGSFISMMGDDIYPERVINEVAMSSTWAMTVVESDSFPDAFDIVPDKYGFLKEAVQDTNGTRGKILLDICLYKLTPDIFQAPLKKLKTKEEFGLPHTLMGYVKENSIPIKILRGDGWLKINNPSDVAIAGKILSSN